jgi:hypothetical protein
MLMIVALLIIIFLMLYQAITAEDEEDSYAAFTMAMLGVLALVNMY